MSGLTKSQQSALEAFIEDGAIAETEHMVREISVGYIEYLASLGEAPCKKTASALVKLNNFIQSLR